MIKNSIETPLPVKAVEADVWLPYEIFAPLHRITVGALTHFDEVDPSILNMDEVRVRVLCDILNNASDDKQAGYNLKLSNLDMIDFEALSIYAEEFFADLGGEAGLQLVPPDITALTEKLRRYRTAAFPGDGVPA